MIITRGGMKVEARWEGKGDSPTLPGKLVREHRNISSRFHSKSFLPFDARSVRVETYVPLGGILERAMIGIELVNDQSALTEFRVVPEDSRDGEEISSPFSKNPLHLGLPARSEDCLRDLFAEQQDMVGSARITVWGAAYTDETSPMAFKHAGWFALCALAVDPSSPEDEKRRMIQKLWG
ncbi:hypothetical protein [Gordonia polyisoprenivorans]|uniref:hypothetical protein n=1 Tax=Gordonia polyisoprenivorans TaxID=84595 RepID=UPI0030D1D9C6